MRSTCALLALLLGCHDPAPTEAPTPATQTEAASAKKRPAPRSAGPNLHALPLTRAEAQLSRYAETQRETHLVRAAAAAETTVREGERHDYARFLLTL